MNRQTTPLEFSGKESMNRLTKTEQEERVASALGEEKAQCRKEGQQGTEKNVYKVQAVG